MTVITPYVAVIPYDFSGESNETARTRIGAVRCDLAGKPFILVSSSLDGLALSSVLLHEKVHVQQSLAFPSCIEFRARYTTDSMFRLAIEAQAYCAVHDTQRAAGATPDPTHQQIVGILRQKYDAEYTDDAVRSALPCL